MAYSYCDIEEARKEIDVFSEKVELIEVIENDFTSETTGSIALNRFSEIFDTITQLVQDYCGDVESDHTLCSQLINSEERRMNQNAESITIG